MTSPSVPSSTVADDALALTDDLVRLRHRIHRHPEVGLHLPRTQQTVLEALQGLDLEIRTGDSLSSVTAVLRGEGDTGRRGHRAAPGQRPVVLLRADMDALPLTEELDVPYRSEVDGVMHACGHDLHVTSLVGAAHLLAAQRGNLPGDVVLMFQPGEEGWDGAGHMIREGVLEAAGRRADAAYALHVMSALAPRGAVASRPGPLLSASDGLFVTLRGRGGHGSAPHRAADPVPAIGEIVLGAQAVAGRTVGPFETGLVTFGKVEAGTRRNIIPSTAYAEATIRTTDPEVRERLHTALVRYCEGVAAAHGLEADVVLEPEYPVTVNDARELDFAREVATGLFGADRWIDMPDPIAGAEDFSRVIDAVPGVMVFLGACLEGRDWETAPDNHSPLAGFDDSVLTDGAALLATLAERRLVQLAGR
ncbi:M20 metallopeptidase family protein [Aquipuribacter sp. SD81]|uniref:M20 metallopeptidase family protein n=1 Tax=Aquipuribacter sp. SD81 TaxID=3127703 RepID=UPI00301B4A7C